MRPAARLGAVSGARSVRFEHDVDAGSLRPSAESVRRTRDRGGRAQTRRNRSDRQAGGTHLVGELVGPGRVEIAAQQLSDLGGSGVELLAERAEVVAVPGELGLEIVQPPRQHGLDRGLVDRLHAGLEARFEGADEMTTDLERCLEWVTQKRRRSDSCGQDESLSLYRIMSFITYDPAPTAGFRGPCGYHQKYDIVC